MSLVCRLTEKKNAAGRGEWTPSFFIKRKQYGFTRPRKNPPKPWPMPERAKPCGEHSEGDFFSPQTEIRPNWNSNTRPYGGDHTSASLANDSRSFGYADFREHQDPMQSQACPSEDLESSHKPHVCTRFICFSCQKMYVGQ